MDWIGEVALATLLVGLFAWLRADLGRLREEMDGKISGLREEMDRKISALRGEISALRGEVSLLEKEMAKLRERIARMEGLLDGLREAVAGKQAA